MEQYQKILTLGIGIMIFCFAFPFIVINIRGPLLETPPILHIIFLFIGFAIILYGLIKWQMYREKGHVVKDERIQKIGDKSRSYTLYITVFFILLLLSLYHSKILDIDIIEIGWLVIIQVTITFIVLRWYLNKKKDL